MIGVSSSDSEPEATAGLFFLSDTDEDDAVGMLGFFFAFPAAIEVDSGAVRGTAVRADEEAREAGRGGEESVTPPAAAELMTDAKSLVKLDDSM